MNTKNVFKTSLKTRWRRLQVLAFLAFYILITIVTVAIIVSNALSSEDLSVVQTLIGAIVSPYSFIFILIILFYALQHFALPSDINGYKLFGAVLDSPKTSFMHICSVYFPISFVVGGGKRITKDTMPLWSYLQLL